jgi:uncharacterized protein YjbI with pentapeptide repeats
MRRSIATGDGAYLADLDARGVDLTEVRILGVHIARCRFITNMCHASFIDAVIEEGDFTYADLRSTMWQRTQVYRSFLRDSSLVDATLDGSTFTDCDLRGADFSMTDGHGLTFGSTTQFLRCDLRGSNWQGRDLSSVTMADCKLHGLAGLTIASRLQLIRADMSPRGDGSQITCDGSPGVLGDGWAGETPCVEAPDSRPPDMTGAILDEDIPG